MLGVERLRRFLLADRLAGGLFPHRGQNVQPLVILRSVVDEGVAAKGGRFRRPAPVGCVGVAVALEHRAEAYRFARQSERDPWEFAVEMQQRTS